MKEKILRTYNAQLSFMPRFMNDGLHLAAPISIVIEEWDDGMFVARWPEAALEASSGVEARAIYNLGEAISDFCFEVSKMLSAGSSLGGGLLHQWAVVQKNVTGFASETNSLTSKQLRERAREVAALLRANKH